VRDIVVPSSLSFFLVSFCFLLSCVTCNCNTRFD
jgi:hypothetical protein